MDQSTVLNNVITKVVKNQSLDVLNHYFSSTPCNSQVFNAQTVSTLLKLLKRETKHENKSLHVAVVISCLKHFLDLKCNPSKWEALAEDLSKLCEVVFVISSSFIQDDTLIENCVEIITALLQQSSSLVDNIMRYSLKSMMDAISLPCSNSAKLAVLALIGTLLQKSSRQARREVLPSTSEALEKLSNFLLLSGDYETQVAVVEILARCWIFVKDTECCPSLFSKKSAVVEIFIKYKFLNFDPECRLFLNEVNEGLGDGQLVYSIPCMTAYADNTRLKKPNDTLYKEFWVDFSLATKSISFYYVPNSEEDWEFMKVLEENILVCVSWNSLCKSKGGEVIPAIKLELTLKPELLKLGLPSILKIYCRKNEQFQRLENTVIKDILENKYKSNVTYDSLPKRPPSEVKEKIIQKPLAQPNKTKFPSCSYNRLQISISQSKSVSPVANFNTSTTLEGHSFYNTSAVSNQSSSHTEPQKSDEIHGNDWDDVSPSLNYSATTIERRKLDQTKSSDTNPKSPVDNLGDSDSPTRYLIEGRKQNMNTNIDGQETYKSTDPVLSVKNSGCLTTTKIDKKNLKSKNELDNRENKLLEYDLKTEELRKEDSKVVKIKENNLDKSVIISNEAKNPGEINTSLPLEYCQTNSIPAASSTPNKILDINELGIQVICNPPTEIAKSSYQKRKSSIALDNNNSSKKRRLYSFENNKNVKDLVMSSQDDCTLEVGVPEYKRTNQESRAKLKHGRENISYSYITHNENIGKVGTSKINDVFSDVNDFLVEKRKEKTTKFFKNSAVDEKKLRALNKTPESTKASNIFPSHSAYSDLSSPEKKKPVKRTYAKPKRQKRFKNVKVLDYSDDDSEYVPPCKISPECVEPQEKKLRSTKPFIKGFVDQLQNERIDPIRDKAHTNDMEIVSLKNINMENPNLTMQVRSVQVATTTISKICKRKNPENVKTPKKTVNRKKKTGESKKLEVHTGQKVVKKIPEDMAVEPSLLFGSSNFVHQVSDIDEDDDFALDLFNCPNTQNKELNQTTFKGTEMVKFGSFSLSHVTNKVKKVQSLAHKEREMNFAAFDFKAQSACTALHTLSEKSEAVANQLSQAISLLQNALIIQSENAIKIKSEASQLEEAKQELMANITKIEKAEASQVGSIFQTCGKYMRNLVVSFARNILPKKALPQPK